MKRLPLLLILFLFLFQPAPILAASWFRTIQIEWGYAPPIEPAVDGFVLYIDGKEVCRFEDAEARTGTCDVIIAAQTTAFTLTASFADGTESPHSAPFEFADTVPAPELMKIIR